LYLYIIGKKIANDNADTKITKKIERRMYSITTIGLLLVCSVSSYIALKDPYTGKNLQGMFNLRNEVSHLKILFMISCGGFSLLLIQIFAERKIIEYYRKDQGIFIAPSST